ncbi:hypothetical protein AB0E81_03895 [Streptomyces sp. NPDC033538]
MDQDWEDRVAAAWTRFDGAAEEDGAAFRAEIDALADELPAGSAVERTCT